MGAEPWAYYVPYEASVAEALEKLRQRVFASGAFHGSELNPATPEEAMANMDADGTRSILDMLQVSDSPGMCSVCRLPDAQLLSLFGTTRPTHEMVEDNMDFYEDINRGEGVYIVVYKDDGPSEYFFAGYSFD